MAGCLEHTGVITQLIREARESKGDLAALWLDLMKAYDSIPHKRVEIALTRYHVPELIRSTILDYYSDFMLSVSTNICLALTGEGHNHWQHNLCTTLLFGHEHDRQVSRRWNVEAPRSDTRQPPIRAFMDNLTVTAPSILGCRWLL